MYSKYVLIINENNFEILFYTNNLVRNFFKLYFIAQTNQLLSINVIYIHTIISAFACDLRQVKFLGSSLIFKHETFMIRYILLIIFFLLKLCYNEKYDITFFFFFYNLTL